MQYSISACNFYIILYLLYTLTTLTASFHFSPLCVETLGAWGSCARSLVQQIGSWVMKQTGDNRATQFLIQKISIDVQRFMQ